MAHTDLESSENLPVTLGGRSGSQCVREYRCCECVLRQTLPVSTADTKSDWSRFDSALCHVRAV